MATSELEPKSEAVPNTHAHNDYENENPLSDALSYGFVSVEADIWLYLDDGGNLRVAHDPVEDPTTLPTFEELYLDPLQDLKEEFDNGGVYPDGTPITLLIDIKNDGLSTYKRLDEVLAKHQAESPGLFTTYTKDETGDYTATPGAVTPIISGDRPREFMESQEIRYAGYDGRSDDIGSEVDSEFMPLISDNWDSVFSDDLAWDGTGTIPEDTEAKLNNIVDEVHEEDQILRFWNLPQYEPSVWEPLYEAGVDLINTDDLAGLSTFIQSQEEPISTSPTFGTLANDTLEVEGSRSLVLASEGNDLIDSSLAEGNNRIFGNGGDDTFVLGEGDHSIGGEGTDSFFVTNNGNSTITGGKGADQFWIAAAEIPEAANTITDFVSGEDVLGIAGLNIGFDDLSITQNGNNTVISTDGQDLASLSGVSSSNLNADNFVFA